MAINKQFEAYKIRREIKRSGAKYAFVRKGDNAYGEPTGADVAVGTLSGIYHEENAAIQIVSSEATQTRTKKIPCILTPYDDAVALGLKVKDAVYMNGKRFEVTGVVNVQEWNIVADVSLEVVDDGVHVGL